ncbi:hypothetical protein DFJ58DRAFT_913109 [Suillus subalutaceus]|uniref:uncharacterized protein n=1 Tax=Suillus subalutaceus TaxID=48586 RepID=UPI001B870513|nr:uncharacterized protein DFJ58DRAFT_913109 [Suillus subalutaceus]KAG1859555.1 hypothetical protein DFJ58DRAFT_913109 [Suillus subalutaceus]
MFLHVRTPKSANSWAQDDLNSYCITIEELEPAQFFPSSLATAAIDATNVSDGTYQILRFMQAATNTTRKADIDEFARVILSAIDFDDKRELAIRVRHHISLLICGEKKSAEVNVCLADWSTEIVHVLQENKTTKNPHDPE